MICGQFLLEKKSTGNLTLNDINLNNVQVKSISEGDTNISYATDGIQDSCAKLDTLIQSLLNAKKYLYKFRRLVW